MLSESGEGVKKEGSLKFKVPVDSDSGIVNSQVTMNFIIINGLSWLCFDCYGTLSSLYRKMSYFDPKLEEKCHRVKIEPQKISPPFPSVS